MKIKKKKNQTQTRGWSGRFNTLVIYLFFSLFTTRHVLFSHLSASCNTVLMSKIRNTLWTKVTFWRLTQCMTETNDWNVCATATLPPPPTPTLTASYVKYFYKLYHICTLCSGCQHVWIPLVSGGVSLCLLLLPML